MTNLKGAFTYGMYYLVLMVLIRRQVEYLVKIRTSAPPTVRSHSVALEAKAELRTQHVIDRVISISI
jgi:hypothetical protein